MLTAFAAATLASLPFHTVATASFGSVVDALPDWLSAASGVIAAASAVTAMTPTPRDDRFVGKIYRLLEFFALNVGHAKDAPPNRMDRD